MKKIPTLFLRDSNNRQVYNEVTPGCEWVRRGLGIATIKYDGTACLIDHKGNLWRRYTYKPSADRDGPPPYFDPSTDFDPERGKQEGWLPVDESPSCKYHREAIGTSLNPEPGTYELVGPKINGNPERMDRHELIPHGNSEIGNAPTDFERLKEALTQNKFYHSIEGIVWHHPDGRMAKIKLKDFGITRRV